MSHYDSCLEARRLAYERSPAGIREKKDRERAKKLRKNLKDVSLGEFTAGELEFVMILFCPAFNANEMCTPPELDEKQLKILEKKVKLLKQKKQKNVQKKKS